MNYHFVVVFLLAIMMALTLAVPEGLKEENVPIFVNLLVQNLFKSSNCHQERKKEGNFRLAQNGECLITQNGLKLLKELKYPCIATVQIGQLDKHVSLKRNLEVLSEGKPLWDENMTRGTNISARTVRRDLIKNVLEKLDVKVGICIRFYWPFGY
jgi:hypothetical protein